METSWVIAISFPWGISVRVSRCKIVAEKFNPLSKLQFHERLRQTDRQTDRGETNYRQHWDDIRCT